MSGAEVPQRANVMVTTGFALPGFDMKMRAYRLYKPATDSTKPTGYKFISDGTALWVAQTPMAEILQRLRRPVAGTSSLRCPTGRSSPFTDANACHAQPIPEHVGRRWPHRLRADPAARRRSSARRRRSWIRPRWTPPPDSRLPGLAADHEDRRTLIFIGANDGMMHAIDSAHRRRGVGVHPVQPAAEAAHAARRPARSTVSRYFVDTSAKVADVKIGGVWRTMVTFGEGVGGTFYQAFDASLDRHGRAPCRPDTDSVSHAAQLLQQHRPHQVSCGRSRVLRSSTRPSTPRPTPYGDLASTRDGRREVRRPDLVRSGRRPDQGHHGPVTIIVGSGFLPRSVESGSSARRRDCRAEAVSAVGGGRTRLRQLQRRQRRHCRRQTTTAPR